MKKNKMNYEDEMAWKERQQEIEKEKETITSLPDYREPIMHRCLFLLDILKKYLIENSVDLKFYTYFLERFTCLYKRLDEEDTDLDLFMWKVLRGSISEYMYLEMGNDNIKKYLPKGSKMSRKPEDGKYFILVLQDIVENTPSKNIKIRNAVVQNAQPQKD